MTDLNLKAPKPRGRRVMEAYFTPPWMVKALTDDIATQPLHHHLLAGGFAIEPCVGEGAIVRGFGHYGLSWLTNDLDPQYEADYHLDAGAGETGGAYPDLWALAGSLTLGTTNPPFSEAARIVPRMLDACETVCVLLRVTWMEARPDRRWLVERPPTREIKLPRWSFTRNGKEDSAPASWFIWSPEVEPGITVVSSTAATERLL